MTEKSLRTLFITRVLPISPRSGSALRNWQNMTIMSRLGDVGVFSVSTFAANEPCYPEISYWQHHQLPRQQKSDWLSSAKSYRNPELYYTPEGVKDLERVLLEFKPNLLIMVEPWFYYYLKVVRRHRCKVILAQENVEFDLNRQMYPNKTLKEKIKRQFILSQLKSVEGKFCTEVDQIWACSEKDALLTKQIYPSTAQSEIIPNGVNLDYYQAVRCGEFTLAREVEQTKLHNVLFMGTLIYPPNSQAVEILIKQVYPQLKQIEPNSRLVIVGVKAPPFMIQAAEEDSGIFVTKEGVPDVRPYLAAASVMVVPLQQGGGTRIKILEAFAAGCPVISTSKGAEGIKAQDGEHLLIADTTEEMVKAISRVWNEPGLRENLVNNAYDFVKREYSWEAIKPRVEKALARLSL